MTIGSASLERADHIMAKGFLLGAHHAMSEADVDYIADRVDEFFAGR